MNNVIWIILDTLRRDHLGCYGNQTVRTPSLDALAARAVRFERHYLASFPTMPARADYYTGRWTGCFMGWQPLPCGLVTLPEILSNAGFHTAAVVDTPFYTSNGMNYDQGFATFIEVPGQEYWGRHTYGLEDDIRKTWRSESDRFAPQTFTRAIQWLEEHHEEDFFLYIDAWDPHEPWDAPSDYTELYWPGYDGEIISPPYRRWQDVPGFSEEMVKKGHACYCGEITMVDTWLGYLLRKIEDLGLMENTAIMLTADHGFYFGEHGGLFGKMILAFPSDTPWWAESGRLLLAPWTHSPLYEEVTACPLLIYAPGVAPEVYRGLTSAVDLMPTVLSILGQEIPAEVEGHSLLPVMKDTKLKDRKFVVSTHPFANRDTIIRSVDGQPRPMQVFSATTVTTEEWTLLYSVERGGSTLYHLPSDPKQEKNIIKERPEVAKELHQLLVEFMNGYNVSSFLLEPRSGLRL